MEKFLKDLGASVWTNDENIELISFGKIKYDFIYLNSSKKSWIYLNSKAVQVKISVALPDGDLVIQDTNDVIHLLEKGAHNTINGKFINLPSSSRFDFGSKYFLTIEELENKFGTTNVKKPTSLNSEAWNDGVDEAELEEIDSAKMALLFSHALTQEQIDDAKQIGVEKFVSLPEDLQTKFSNISSDNREEVKEELKSFLKNSLNEKDYVLIQGEYGVTYSIVKFCEENNFIPVYSVSKRVSSEIKKDGVIEKVSYFKHEGFVKY